jgi:hypothetical protein
MKKIFGIVRLSPIGVVRAEYVGLGVLMSLLSAFLGFYSAAFIMADKCFPELGVGTIQAVHRELFSGIPLAAAGYTLLVFALFWVFAREHIKRTVEAHGREGKRT